jgi:hypothetical protein
MTWYCKPHPDFEGLTFAHLQDHIEKDHPEVQEHGKDYKTQIAAYFRENVETSPYRRSDGKMIERSWGRPPKIGNWLGDNQKEK